MSIKTLLVGATAAGIALGSFGLAGDASAAAMMMKKPHHPHALVCKRGFAPHKVKWHGKWHWVCQRISHHHPMKPMKPMHPKPMKTM
ncbi:MAG: hypothetical protein ABI399_12575 [Bauldia sp.]